MKTAENAFDRLYSILPEAVKDHNERMKVRMAEAAQSHHNYGPFTNEYDKNMHIFLQAISDLSVYNEK